ncbi:MAG: SOS response-associated peptidase [Aphanocapsa lilacina HA4352-LM1]|jgi:putative SOS response-associated peptidase YedK|nr:SOS response-associated peptidase [Aphanocapsa lilacina HA4352-LM1]
MCGRFTLAAAPEAVAAAFELPEAPPLTPRYNIAPSRPVCAVRTGEGTRREAVFLRWGLIPSWSNDPAIGNRLINARAETLVEKPSFRAAFKARRCLVVADGFYEWQRQDGTKQPFYLRLQDARPFAFAGLWERWEPGEGPTVETCTIITTAANAVLAPIHERMPVILAPDDYERWLDPSLHQAEALLPLLRPYPPEAMHSHPVDIRVGNPIYDNPRCVEPVD